MALPIFLSVIVLFLSFHSSCQQQIFQNDIKKDNVTDGTTEEPVKSRTLYDYQTRVVAYKDLIDSKCILEILDGSKSHISKWMSNNSSKESISSSLSVSNQLLSKRQTWNLAGQRITEFCRGFPTYLIKDSSNDGQNEDEDHLNELAVEDTVPRRRRTRSTRHYFQGRVRGQTQSQYLSFGGSEQPGKAEAESTFEGSKAVVSGSNGMGQAQSQSSPIGCEDCYGQGFNGQEQVLGFGYGQGSKYPDNLIHGGPGRPEQVRGEQPDQGRPEGPGRHVISEPGSGEPGRSPGGSGYIIPGGPGRTQVISGGPGSGPGGHEGFLPVGPVGPGQVGPRGHNGQEQVGPEEPGQIGTGGHGGQGQMGPEGPGGQGQIEAGRPGQIGPGGHDGQGQIGTGGPGQISHERPEPIGPTGGHGQTRPVGPEQGGPLAPIQTGPKVYPARPGGPGQTIYGPEQISYGPGQGSPGTAVIDLDQSFNKPTQDAGVFGGQLAGGYQSNFGQKGRFSGTFSGRYEGDRTGYGGFQKPQYPQHPVQSLVQEPPRGQGPAYIPGHNEQPSIHGPPYGQVPRHSPTHSTQPPVLSYSNGQPSGQSPVHGQTPGYSPTYDGYPSVQGPPHGQGPNYLPSYSGQPSVQGPSPIEPPSYSPNYNKQPSVEGPPQTQIPSNIGYDQSGGKHYSTTRGEQHSQVNQYGTGQRGRFSGQFSGEYETIGPQGPSAAFQYAPGTPSQNGVKPGQYGTGGAPSGTVQYGPSGPQQYGTGGDHNEPVHYGPSGPEQYGTGGGPSGTVQYVPGGPGQYGTGGTVQYGPGGPGQYGTGGIPSGTVQYGPSGPGQYGTGGTPSGTQQYSPSGTQQYPANRPEQYGTGGTPTGTQQYGPSGPGQYGTGGTLGGTVQYGPSGPGQYGTGGTPGGTVQYGPSGPAQYGVGESPSGAQYGPSGPGQYSTGGTPSGTVQYGPSGPGQYGVGGTPSGTQQYEPNGPGQYGTGGTVQYGPSGPGQYGTGGTATGTGQYGPNQQLTQGSQVPDDSDSQVQTSVQQTENGTHSEAAAQGTYGGGTAQSQVSGTYSGSGSFSASAGSDDGKRGAQTQVSGGKDGAQSSAQGRGGLGNSQSSVIFSSETGNTLSSAQSSGFSHGTQSHVQASEKGGMADAQANAPGSTSSQAQIGFSPYDEKEEDNQTIPFRGGGTAGAQGGAYSGMSQTQVQGKFRYGIKYTGAAQAGSGGANTGGNYTFRPGPFHPTQISPFSIKNDQSQTLSQKKPSTPEKSNKNVNTTRIEAAEPKVGIVDKGEDTEEDTDYTQENKDYNDNKDYAEADYPESSEAPSTRSIITQSSDNQRQHIVLDPLENLDISVYQSKGDFSTVLQPGDTIPGSPGYRIPLGFRGTVKSISNGRNTYAIGQNSHAQSVTVSPGSGKIIYKQPVYAVASKTHFKNGQYGYGSGYTYQPTYQPVKYLLKNGKVLPNFVSVTKSETGLANLLTGKKTPSVYYSQSSSCGVFTNHCIFRGNKKVCSPKLKTNPDGTLMAC